MTGFSDKRYRVCVLLVKPTFGTSKKLLKELASCEINISEYAARQAPTALTLQLDRKAHDGMPLEVSLTISARPVTGGEDDDDAISTSSALTGFSAGRRAEPAANQAPAREIARRERSAPARAHREPTASPLRAKRT